MSETARELIESIRQGDGLLVGPDAEHPDDVLARRVEAVLARCAQLTPKSSSPWWGATGPEARGMYCLAREIERLLNGEEPKP
jgi:hypothetical protein